MFVVTGAGVIWTSLSIRDKPNSLGVFCIFLCHKSTSAQAPLTKSLGKTEHVEKSPQVKNYTLWVIKGTSCCGGASSLKRPPLCGCRVRRWTESDQRCISPKQQNAFGWGSKTPMDFKQKRTKNNRSTGTGDLWRLQIQDLHTQSSGEPEEEIQKCKLGNKQWGGKKNNNKKTGNILSRD